MISARDVKIKMHGKELHWYFGKDSDRWKLVVPSIKKRLLRELWEVTLWDRLLGRDVPHCGRCKEENLESLHVILCTPLCDCCYDDYSSERAED